MKPEQHSNLKQDKSRLSDRGRTQGNERKMPALVIILVALIVGCITVLLLSALSAYW